VTTVAPLPSSDALRIAVVGLGYVGLPLAVTFGREMETVGFDVDPRRIEELKAGHDRTLEVDDAELEAAQHLTLTAELERLRACNVFIATVPTPIDANKRPELTPLIRASESIGQVLSRGDVVIYESTVYPGATEEVCVPVLVIVTLA
jgi:UDP-N-acetyl-D-galactosamine dehydrogenase